MGVSITANNSRYDFDMGYGGFFNLRKNVALALDQEFGENYALLSRCVTKRQFSENDQVANMIIQRKQLDEDIVSFLYMPDTGGKINYRICKKISNLLKKVDLSDKSFRYAAYAHNDYQEFIEFLDECYSKRRDMVWY